MTTMSLNSALPHTSKPVTIIYRSAHISTPSDRPLVLLPGAFASSAGSGDMNPYITAAINIPNISHPMTRAQAGLPSYGLFKSSTTLSRYKTMMAMGSTHLTQNRIHLGRGCPGRSDRHSENRPSRE